jgi:hypothetical protein
VEKGGWKPGLHPPHTCLSSSGLSADAGDAFCDRRVDVTFDPTAHFIEGDRVRQRFVQVEVPGIDEGSFTQERIELDGHIVDRHFTLQDFLNLLLDCDLRAGTPQPLPARSMEG